MTPPPALSVLDLSPLAAGMTARDALLATLDLARHAESLGLHRYWVTFSIVWAVERANARKRLAEFDQGRRCIACENTSVQVAGDSVQCLTCGHRASLAALRSVKLTEAEIATMTTPD